MSEDAVASVHVAEIQRLRAIIAELEAENERLRMIDATPEGWGALFDAQGAELQKAYDRVTALEMSNQALAAEQFLDELRDRLEKMHDNALIASREADRHISQSQARILALEAEIAVMRGTLARPDTADDGPVTLIEGTPNAPR
jgi:hypothetical protein